MVPYRMIISCRRTREHPVLGPICAKYPECFKEGQSDDWEQLTLTLALMYETTLGLKSFWYPYLRILPEDASDLLPCFWSDYELEIFQEDGLPLDLEEFKTEMNFYWDRFEQLMKDQPHIFPEPYRSRELFMSMFSNVISRCFGEGIDTTSLVPAADNLNHSSIGGTFEVINKTLQRRGAANPSYYTIERFLVDSSIAFQKPDGQGGDAEDLHKNLVDNLSEEERLNIRGRYNRKLYEHNVQALSSKNIRLNLQGGQHIWQIPFFEDSHDEDNDTTESEDSDDDEEEQDEEKTNKKKTEKTEKKMEGKHGFEEIIRQEQELLVEIEKARIKAQRAMKKQEQQKMGGTSSGQADGADEDAIKQAVRKNIEDTLRECNVSDAGIAEALAQQNIEDGLGMDPQIANLNIDDETLDRVEYIRNDASAPVREQEEKWLQGEEESSDEDGDSKLWAWMEPLRQEDKSKFEEETYFTMANYSRKPMKKGDQAFISYGCRTNYFLLQSYGFALEDNLQESFKFYVRLDLALDYKQKQSFTVKDMIVHSTKIKHIQEIRLKRD